MLRLTRVQILGFKSFCDRTDVSLAGRGIAAVVGPNGCGKSNISDAITWVLGEQSAKSLRGVKMEDVIFAGTRERKPTGMAEVSLTLVDPELYDGAELHPEGPELVVAERHPEEDEAEDWDEEQLRSETAAETEAAVADAQPGMVLGGDESAADGAGADAGAAADRPKPKELKPDGVQPDGATVEGGVVAADEVVLRIRRRKFNRAPVRAGEVTVTRRLFRTGDSEYLLNGRICRLRDIQDIFLGTGLGGESYAIIGQERIGQLLSSKPFERRGIIEEAAGITRFKTKKRLAELRLESAKQNLSRLNDIFDEVTRQMGSLKRQAAKAERYGALRDELRAKLRVVLHSRMALLDSEAARTAEQIAQLTVTIDAQAEEIERLDAEHTAGTARGYELDGAMRAANTTASRAAVELERVTSRESSNRERVVELTTRLEAGAGEVDAARAQVAELTATMEQQRVFLEGANAESGAARAAAMQRAAEAQNAVRAVGAAEQQMEASRRQILQSMQRAGAIRNEIAQAETALGNLEAEAQRLQRESDTAREELAALGQQRGQIKLTFESVSEKLQRLEAETAQLRLTVEEKRRAESEGKRRADALRSELATLQGKRHSLEGLIRDHSYSTETVKNLFRVAKKAAHAGGGAVPIGTLADFLEPETQFGEIVDEFLRDELNFVVVEDWGAAEHGVRLLRTDVNGRATFLVQPRAEAGAMEGSRAGAEPEAEGLVALRDAVRVSGALAASLTTMLPKLRDGYIARDVTQARELAERFPECWFLAASGEVCHARTVTAGRASASGPLALKRDLRELTGTIETREKALADAVSTTSALTREIAEAVAAIERSTQERREAEREAAHSGAALRQMDSEAQRLNRRLQEWQQNVERTREQRNAKTDLIARRRAETEAADREHIQLEQSLTELQGKLAKYREDRDRLQAAAAEASAAMAGLDERRRSAQSSSDQTGRLLAGQTSRLQQLEAQLAAAAAERERREGETATLEAQQVELRETHATAAAEGTRLAAEATELRQTLGVTDARLRVLRAEADAAREERAQLGSRAARLTAEIEHVDEACRGDLNMEPEALRAETEVAKMEAEELAAQEAETRAMKARLEAMGPVNMMALEEFHEASQRHGFLETQRKDLQDSIGNTQASIREIDEVSRERFDNAFRAINENFSITFTKLFGGGQALMKLTDEENAAESGIDIVASPPGKKLQNILLLSGGEKALTALSLLVGIFQFQPAPFCILDEVDAPLDETNVGRFAKLIADMSAATQFLVITHSKRTMEQADVIYGVTMQEPGVSKVVSVNLSQRKENKRRAVA